MTRNKTVVDSNIPLLMDDELANPYNKRKDWHNQEPVSTQDANSLFYEKRPAKPKKEEPVVETATSAEKKQEHDYEKRWKDLKKQYDELATKFNSMNTQQLEKVKEEIKLPEAPEELAALKEQNPVLYKQLEAATKFFGNSQVSDIKEKLTDIEKREFEFAKTKARDELKKAHPDVEEIVASDEWEAWSESQPQEVQQWIKNNPTNSALAIRVLDLFKADQGIKKQTVESQQITKSVQQDASSLVSPKTSTQIPDGNKKIWTRREIQSLSMRDYEKYEQEIDNAIMEGRVAP